MPLGRYTRALIGASEARVELVLVPAQAGAPLPGLVIAPEHVAKFDLTPHEIDAFLLGLPLGTINEVFHEVQAGNAETPVVISADKNVKLLEKEVDTKKFRPAASTMRKLAARLRAAAGRRRRGRSPPPGRSPGPGRRRSRTGTRTRRPAR